MLVDVFGPPGARVLVFYFRALGPPGARPFRVSKCFWGWGPGSLCFLAPCVFMCILASGAWFNVVLRVWAAGFQFRYLLLYLCFGLERQFCMNTVMENRFERFAMLPNVCDNSLLMWANKHSPP